MPWDMQATWHSVLRQELTFCRQVNNIQTFHKITEDYFLLKYQGSALNKNEIIKTAFTIVVSFFCFAVICKKHYFRPRKNKFEFKPFSP